MPEQATVFFEEREVGNPPKKVKVAVRQMTREEARTAYPNRPASKYAETIFGGNELVDDVCLMLNGNAERCKMCGAPTRTKYLNDGTCPECDGRGEYNGHDPHRPH